MGPPQTGPLERYSIHCFRAKLGWLSGIHTFQSPRQRGRRLAEGNVLGVIKQSGNISFDRVGTASAVQSLQGATLGMS